MTTTTLAVVGIEDAVSLLEAHMSDRSDRATPSAAP
jgi:hypothetical protein